MGYGCGVGFVQGRGVAVLPGGETGVRVRTDSLVKVDVGWELGGDEGATEGIDVFVGVNVGVMVGVAVRVAVRVGRGGTSVGLTVL